MLLREYYNNRYSTGGDKNKDGEISGQESPATPVVPSGTSVHPPLRTPEPVTPPSAGQQIMDAAKKPEDVRFVPKDGQDLYNVLLNNRYQESKEDIERQRKASLLGDIANLFGQTIASSQGARKFAPIQSKVPYYNQQLQRLKDWKNNADLTYTLNQARQDAAEKQYKAKMDWERTKMQVGQANKDREFALKVAELDRKVKQGKISAEQAAAKLEELERHNRKMEGIAGRNAETSAVRAANSGQGGSKGKKMSAVVSVPGRGRMAVEFDESRKGALISLHKRMKDLVKERNAAIEAKNKNRAKSEQIPLIPDIEDINLIFGEGGDSMSKAITIVQRRLQDFPELTEEFYKLIGQEMPKPEQKGILLPGVNSNSKPKSLLPQ